MIRWDTDLELLAPPRKPEMRRADLDHRPAQKVAKPEDARHGFRGGPPQEVPTRRRLAHAARLVDHDAISKLIGLREVMRDQNGRHPPVRQNGLQFIAERTP